MRAKTLFGLFVLGLLVLLTGCPPREPSHLDSVSVDDDYWPFDCTELRDYMDQYGVTDADGNGHPGFVGWTLVVFHYSGFTYSRGFSSRGGFNCPCNNTVYETMEQCFNGCKVTLGCFTGICEPIGQTCVYSNQIDVRFSADVQISVAKWDRSGDMPAGCLVDKLRWEAAALRHEQHHAKDFESVLEDVDRRWKSGQHFEACGPSESEADANLREAIQRALDSEIEFLKSEGERLGNEYHSSPEGGRFRSINCELCD